MMSFSKKKKKNQECRPPPPATTFSGATPTPLLDVVVANHPL